MESGMAKEILSIQNLDAWISSRQVLDKVNFTVKEGKVLSIIGPMGSGKSSLLRCINRLFEERAETQVAGQVEFYGKNVYENDINIFNLRREIGMVFSEPTPFFHMTIFENVAIGLRLAEIKSGSEIGEAVEATLQKVSLWDDVKSQLHKPVNKLQPYQQQLLCLARALVLKPKLVLMDEPTSVIGLQGTMIFEQLIKELAQKTTVIFTSSSRKQAARVSDRTAFLLDGELIEIGKTSDLFMNPKDSRTEDYLTGRFG